MYVFSITYTESMKSMFIDKYSIFYLNRDKYYIERIQSTQYNIVIYFIDFYIQWMYPRINKMRDAEGFIQGKKNECDNKYIQNSFND